MAKQKCSLKRQRHAKVICKCLKSIIKLFESKSILLELAKKYRKYSKIMSFFFNKYLFLLGCKEKSRDRSRLFHSLFLVVAAATENYDYSKDDYPGAVIVKKMA